MNKKSIESLRSKVYCLTCDRDITGRTHVCCQDCDNIAMCIVCFSRRKEANAHLASHRYSIVGRINVPLEIAGWTIHDELQLVEGLEKFGYGNWQEIAKFVGTHSDKAVEYHLAYRGLGGAAVCGAGSEEDFRKLEERIRESLEPALQVAREKSERLGINLSDKTGFGQVIGYWPLRREFEVEYNNDAELYIADMEFSPDDSESETKTKLCILEIYHARLREREEKTRFVIEHDLININEVFNKERAMTEEERRVRTALKDKMPFLTKPEFEELVQCCLMEVKYEQYRQDLMELQRCNVNTLQDFEDLLFNEQFARANAQDVDALNRAHEKTGVTVQSKRVKSKQNAIQEQEQRHTVEPSQARENMPKELSMEYELIEKTGLTAEEYTVVKQFLIQNARNLGKLQREKMQEELKIQPRQFELIFNHLLGLRLIAEEL